MPEQHGIDLTHLVALFAAAVISVPIFKRIGLGPIIGYLFAGVIIGPSVLGLFDEAESVSDEGRDQRGPSLLTPDSACH